MCSGGVAKHLCSDTSSGVEFKTRGTCDGVQRLRVLDLPQARARGVAHALRLRLARQVRLDRDEPVAVGVLRAVWQCLHVHLREDRLASRDGIRDCKASACGTILERVCQRHPSALALADHAPSTVLETCASVQTGIHACSVYLSARACPHLADSEHLAAGRVIHRKVQPRAEQMLVRLSRQPRTVKPKTAASVKVL